MNKKSSDKLNSTINALITRLEKAESFVLDQAPDVCKEVVAEKKSLLAFGFTVSVGFSTLLIALATASFICLSPLTDHYDICSQRTAYTFIFIALSIIPTICSISAFSDILSLRAAPKLTILRELRKLVKNEEK